MKLRYFIASLFVFFTSCGATTKTRPENMENTSKKSFYDFKLKSLDGKEEISFERYRGKKVLLVNVASKCGFTPQYEQLQTLHEKYGDKVTVLGFPANNFGGQEPGTAEEIATFCRKNYGVSFQMFEKISVKGPDQHPLYQWLSKKELNGWNDQAPTWNFCKYLVNEKGELVKFFNSSVNPMGSEILKAIGV
ncbi:MAG: glutathione peroxidase [Microscillaceae bacterium]|nr:glutathione peroxidase [Microscillaceae bacterium]MDW8461645.1 glutathione peroxidase [Cytophagales bacterium]